MGEAIAFKGFKDGLQLIFDETVEFNEALLQLKAKLASAADFFTPEAKIKVVSPALSLTSEQQKQLTTLLAEFGLTWQEESFTKEQEETCLEAVAQESEGHEIQALVVNKTLRSGQKVVYRASVLVIGDLNYGAEVVAGGDIVVMGTCRGVAHAGAGGDRKATITANRLLASQLRIAGVIARAPDNVSKPEYAETARISTNGTIVIEPANR
jgi:septum site-determining protein MinC